MKFELKSHIKNILSKEVNLLEELLEISNKKKTLQELEEKINNGDYSPKILKEKSAASKILETFETLKKEKDELEELIEITTEEDVNDIKLIAGNVKLLDEKIAKLKIEGMFKEEADSFGAFVEINSGAGGTESQDWAEILERIYLRWAESKGFKVEIINRLMGEEAGIKNSILKIEGENVYGWLRYETGVHRLVRVSPFNAQGKRQTSFASLLVLPLVENVTNIVINPSDLKIDTYRASGAGGQHVNTTDSAVRITHIPTGVVAACQDGRSQFKNKEEAMRMLYSKLYEIEERKKRERKDSIEKDDVSWGNQIRNYVLHPYKLVKDTRTNYETLNSEKVLNGEIEDFLIACILKLSKKSQQ
jgi:peptide chain release factor 2